MPSTSTEPQKAHHPGRPHRCPRRASISSASTVTRVDRSPQLRLDPLPPTIKCPERNGMAAWSHQPREVRAETSPLGHLRAGSLTDAWMVMPF